MITTHSRIEDKKHSELILPPMDILETFPCEKDVDPSHGDLAVSKCHVCNKIGHQDQVLAKITKGHRKLIRDKLACCSL
ncbi:hypothetical protein Tco_0845862 [Tanacetum coccineum]